MDAISITNPAMVSNGSYLTQIGAKHYKCLKLINVALGRFNILIGPNASGKTTLLDICAFLRDALEKDVGEAVRKRGRHLKELVWLQRSGSFEFVLQARFPKNLAPVAPRFGNYSYVHYEVEIGLSSQGEISVLRENLWLREKPSETKNSQRLLFPQEWDDAHSLVRPPRTKSPKGWRLVIRKTEKGINTYFRSERTKWNFSFRVPDKRLALSVVPEDSERFPIALWFRDLLKDCIHILQLSSQKMRLPCPPDAPRTFQADGSNLPIIVRELQESSKERFKWWLGHLKTVLEDLKGIRVIERDEDRHLYLEATFSNDLKAPSWMLSDGTLRFLALTLIPYLPNSGQIYLIEEPENGIHPKALEALFESLSSVYEGQVFLATHSPPILAMAKPEDLLCFARTESGATDIVRGSEHPKLIQWRKGITLDTLFASGVLG